MWLEQHGAAALQVHLEELKDRTFFPVFLFLFFCGCCFCFFFRVFFYSLVAFWRITILTSIFDPILSQCLSQRSGSVRKKNFQERENSEEIFSARFAEWRSQEEKRPPIIEEDM